MNTYLIIGDAHLPFVSKSCLKKIYKVAEELNPDYIVQVGDLYDHYSHAKFPRSHNVITPRNEVEQAFDIATEFWANLRRVSRKASCYQILGNHDVRPYKRILERYPEVEKMLSFKDFYKFPGVQTIHDSREELIIKGIVFQHGHYSGLGKHCLYNLKPTVVGHSHVGGVVFYNINGKTIWELNAGYIGNPKSVPLSYTAQRQVRWTHGYAVIDSHGPRFCPL